ncbi:hypothetical protein CIK87_00275 [Prevotella sp. P5-64]|nr:hypothetical protein CIK87_00275 [Prevotella sp. P5-64]
MRAKSATLGNSLSNVATLKELRLAVGVTRSRIMGCYLVEEIIGLSITPSAKRNTYSVAILFCINTQGRGAARLNPGLGKRNSYRVAGGAYRPQWANNTAVMGRGVARLNPGLGKQQFLQSCRGCVASTMG